MQICTFTQTPFNTHVDSRQVAWWWNHTKPQHNTLFYGWDNCENARELTDAEYAALIPVLDDLLLALEYARNPPYGD